MRPKKRILLIDNDEYRTSLRSFMLSTHAYRVIPAATAEDAEALFGEVFPDTVLAAADFPGIGKLLQRLHECDPYVAQVVIADSGQECNVICDAYLSKPSVAELLERVRVSAARKRGPRAATPDVSRLRAELTTRSVA